MSKMSFQPIEKVTWMWLSVRSFSDRDNSCFIINDINDFANQDRIGQQTKAELKLYWATQTAKGCIYRSSYYPGIVSESLVQEELVQKESSLLPTFMFPVL